MNRPLLVDFRCRWNISNPVAGRDVQKVVTAVREALGGRFYVQKVAGCIKKHLATCFSLFEQYFFALPLTYWCYLMSFFSWAALNDFTKVGSRAKGTHLRSSDVDLKVMGPRPLTECDREALSDRLKRKFRCVRTTPNIHKVGRNWGPPKIWSCKSRGLVWTCHSHWKQLSYSQCYN